MVPGDGIEKAEGDVDEQTREERIRKLLESIRRRTDRLELDLCRGEARDRERGASLGKKSPFHGMREDGHDCLS